jgi:hypothetical protein
MFISFRCSLKKTEIAEYIDSEARNEWSAPAKLWLTAMYLCKSRSLDQSPGHNVFADSFSPPWVCTWKWDILTFMIVNPRPAVIPNLVYFIFDRVRSSHIQWVEGMYTQSALCIVYFIPPSIDWTGRMQMGRYPVADVPHLQSILSLMFFHA